jgi:RNA polymerase sigma-70 factor, ECF subfamily
MAGGIFRFRLSTFPVRVASNWRQMTHVDRLAAPPLFVVTENEAGDDDVDVVRRARQRDMAAFERLYRAHLPRVHAICLRMTANPTRAEDLTQKTFVTVWQKLPLFRGESAFTSWLHRVAVNTVLAEMRADHRRTERVFGTDDPATFERPPPAPPAGVRLDLEQAIANLPPQARTVFVLYQIEGWQHDEIAGQLGVAVGTSKAQLHRARKLLQEALQ